MATAPYGYITLWDNVPWNSRSYLNQSLTQIDSQFNNMNNAIAAAGKVKSATIYEVSTNSFQPVSLTGDGQLQFDLYIDNINGLQLELDGKAAVGASYAKAESDSKLSTKADAANVYDKTTADGRFAPKVHTHVIADVTNLQASLDAKAPAVADFPVGGNMDAYTTTGEWRVYSSDGALNAPVASPTGRLSVTGHSATVVQQSFYSWSPSAPGAWIRSLNGTTWSAWFKTDALIQDFPTNGDLNTYTASGEWRISTSDNPLNWPADIPVAAARLSVTGHSATVVQQTLVTWSMSEPLFFARSLNGTTWSAWFRLDGVVRDFPSGGDLNNYVATGEWRTQTSDSPLNWPAGVSFAPARLSVTAHSTNVVTQELLLWSNVGAQSLFTRSLNATEWTAWTRLNSAPGDFPSGGDFNNYVTTSEWVVSSTDNALNRPIATTSQAGRLTVTAISSTSVLQRFESWSSNRVWLRSLNTSTWSSWNEIGASGAGGVSTLEVSNPTHEHLIRLSTMKRKIIERNNNSPVILYQPAIVSIIMDHGLTNFKSKIYPMLMSRSIPVTLAINAGKMGDATNSGATWDDVTSWSDSMLVELANHGMNHIDPTTLQESIDEIRGGREAIEANTGREVWVYQTCNSTWGKAIDDLVNHPRGRVAMASHAVVTGMMTSSALHPITGEQFYGGGSGLWLDGGNILASVQSNVTEAVNSNRMLVLRFHPQFLDDGTHITSSEVEQILDYLVQQRSNGNIAIMPYGTAVMAKRPGA